MAQETSQTRAAPPPTAALVDKLRWFEEAVLPFEAALHARLRRILPQTADVEDVVSEVLLRAFNSADGMQVVAVGPWLFRIARNLMIDAARRDRIVRLDLVADFDLLDDAGASERGMVARDQLRRAQAALDALPVQQRRALLLRRVDDRSMREVADIMALSVSTVEKHVAHAVRGLVRSLGDDGVAGDEYQRPVGNRRGGGLTGRALR